MTEMWDVVPRDWGHDPFVSNLMHDVRAERTNDVLVPAAPRRQIVLDYTSVAVVQVPL